MSEQIRLTLHDIQQPMMCPSLVASEGLELPMRPSCQDAVDVPQGGIESRLIETAVIVDPATNMVVEHPRQIVERLVAAFVKFQCRTVCRIDLSALPLTAGLNETPNPCLLRDSRGRNV